MQEDVMTYSSFDGEYFTVNCKDGKPSMLIDGVGAIPSDALIILPSIYKKNKTGNVQEWYASVKDGVITTFSGILDGKYRETITTCEGKNIGKKNATTPVTQAVSESISKWNNKVAREGYSLDMNSETPFSPMLAYVYTPELLNRIVEKTKSKYVLVGNKLNGVRRYFKEGILYTKKGVINDNSYLDEIRECCGYVQLVLANALETSGFTDIDCDDIIIDGELYKHGMPLEDIQSCALTGSRASLQLEYRVFDFYCKSVKINALERLELLASAFSDVWYAKVSFVPNEVLPTVSMDVVHEEVAYMRDEACTKGYEGVMVRVDMPYEPSVRSNRLLKYKPMKDAEYKIIGTKPVKDVIKKSVTMHQAEFICIATNGETFNVAFDGAKERRLDVYNNPDKYINEFVNVTFPEYTKKGVPRHGVAKYIRNEVEM